MSQSDSNGTSSRAGRRKTRRQDHDAPVTTNRIADKTKTELCELAQMAALLHQRMADALPVDHMPGEAADVAICREIALRLSCLIST